MTGILITGLAISLWRVGGMAFSPGRLSALKNPGKTVEGYPSHADFESECKRCHQPLKTTQAVLCLECHQEVGVQISENNGVHGNIEDGHRCAVCHTEHRGRNFDLLTDAINRYDHTATSFSLDQHHLNFDTTRFNCTNCHDLKAEFTFMPSSCTDCHAKPDPVFMSQHATDYGNQCLLCHDGHDRMIPFDHATTNFPLEGKHVSARCVVCHHTDDPYQTSEAFRNISGECSGCHAEPGSHQGLFDPDCSKCHSSAGWKPALIDGTLFDHQIDTGFSLSAHTDTGKRAVEPLLCTDCHPASINQFSLAVCTDCHAQMDFVFIQSHQEQVGPNCLDCHDGADRMASFDHAGYFPLNGSHSEAGCLNCHTNGYKGLVSTCVSCHAEPEIHVGFFGQECQDCHTTQAWNPALLRKHNFPVDHGGEGVVSCITCHPAKYSTYTCYGCHEHEPDQIIAKHLDEGIPMEELPACTSCHPNGHLNE